MPDVTASRTLVKSAPELWTECSDADSLSRHLDPFGDIRITRLEPETAVAWEGELASGTVRLEPSGWGTRVVLTATPAPTPVSAPPATAGVPKAGEVSSDTVDVAAALVPAQREAQPVVAEAQRELEAEAATEPEAAAELEVRAPRQPGFFARLFARFRGRTEAAVVLAEEPEPEREGVPEAEAVPEADVVEPEAVEPEPESVPEPDATAVAPDPEAVLMAALDSLGQAHHRPYSRA
jgi:hypothetical protein